MAALAAASSFVLTRIPSAAPSCSRAAQPPRGGSLQVECAHHVNPKATKKHNKRRPKKHSLSDKKRGGTKDYGPFDPAPKIFDFLDEAGEPEMVEASAVKNIVVEHSKLEALCTREAILAKLRRS